MPELPDVEGYHRYFARYGAGRKVSDVEVLDAEMVRNASAAAVERALTGRRFRGWTRESRDAEPFDRLRMRFRDGTLTYRSKRRLGGMWLARDDEEIEGITGPLGPDALGLDAQTFTGLLAGRRGAIKAALMDQALLAGIGTELSDEMLWHAHIDPRRAVSDLADGDLRALHRALVHILRTSTRHGRIPTGRGWFKGVRGESDPRCPRCGSVLRTPTVAGRTAYVCESCQS
jgi:formamidopyrimidine-DNA glycosylase